MSSEDGQGSLPVVEVANLSKHYRVYSKPHHRIAEGISHGIRSRLEESGSIRVVKAVDDVSFSLKRGESLSILGENGSGKSTLLQLMAGVIQPTHGTVKISGRVSAILELGAGFNPEFSGRSNALLNAKIFGLDPSEEGIMQRIEEFADLGEFFDAPVKTYSSGMYVRLAFAAAIMVRPEILIIDEALAVGDMFFQQKCFDFIEDELADVAKILVSHDLASASRFSERCLILRDGSLEFDGSVHDGIQIYTAHKTRSYRRVVAERSERDEKPSIPSSDPSATGSIEPDSSGRTDGTSVQTGAIESAAELFSVIRITELRSAEGNLLGGNLQPVSSGDSLILNVYFHLGTPVGQPVFGYFLRNRTGLFVFGYNTASQAIQLPLLEAGTHTIRIELTWPDVEPGFYSLSVGLGDGAHPLHHEIIGWSQGVASVECITREPVHGVFNNPATFELVTG